MACKEDCPPNFSLNGTVDFPLTPPVDRPEEPAGDSPPWKQIVAKAVHDMRTPLSSMRISLEVLRMTGADAQQRGKLIAMLDKQVDELAGLLEMLSKDPCAFVAPPPAAQKST
jgi:hypothetical protein